ncbi:MAG: autotransporter domain-containing protein [Alphaproteobacteria bacterium]|nr:autotransporter domain-containing protein [Alphaproteobacteria bacterium]
MKNKFFAVLLAGTFLSTNAFSWNSWNYQGEGNYSEYSVYINQTTNITGDLYFNGGGPGYQTYIISNGNLRAFQIDSGRTGSLALENSGVGSIKNAAAQSGGGIWVSENATMTKIILRLVDNRATQWNGGGIFNAGRIYSISDMGDTYRGYNSGNFANQTGGAIFNASSGTIDEIDMYFSTNTANKYGGAIGNEGKIGTITSTLSSNIAGESGGAIYNVGTIDKITASFQDNEAKKYNGGAIFNGGTITDIINGGNYVFKGNKAAQNGGGIFNGATGKITNVTVERFQENQAQKHGGAISNEGSINHISAYSFYSNTAQNEGGAIYNIGTITDISGSFFSNSAKNGGAVANSSSEEWSDAAWGYVTFTGNTEKISGTFTGNTATESGGAIYNTGTIKEISGSFTSNKTTTYDGGAVYNAGSVTDIKADSFSKNSAKRSGGAVYNLVNGKIVNINTSFSENEAQKYGGAIGNEGEIDAINSSFSLNKAGETGGAVYNIGTIKEISGKFTSNSANLYNGGAIYNDGNITNIQSDSFSKNTSVQNSGAIFNGVNGKIADITVTSFSENSSQKYAGAIGNEGSIDNITADFSSNIAGISGGAVYNDGIIQKISGDFSSNSANAYNGGAIYNSDTINKIESSMFEKNSAVQNGGAIFNSVDGTIDEIVVADFGFVANESQNKGGAIGNEGNINNISSSFSENYAKGEGGAIYNVGTIKNIIADFSSNKTDTNGSAIANTQAEEWSDNQKDYVLYTGTIENITGTFDNNYAGGNGGAVYNSGILESIKNSSFSNNTAEGLGGAIYSSNGLNLFSSEYDMLFENNKDSTGANDIYMEGGELNINLTNNGTITFESGINGKDYNINTSGDGTGTLNINSSFGNVGQFIAKDININLVDESFLDADVLQMTNVNLNIANEKTGAISIKDYIADATTLTMDVDTKNNTSDILKVANDISGETKLIINMLSSEKQTEEIVLVEAQSDSSKTNASFTITRLIGNPYVYDVETVHDEGSNNWLLPYADISKKGSDVTPETLAGIGLHTAGIEQTRNVVRNVAGKVASSQSYCPNCGIVSDAWDGKLLRNVWVLADASKTYVNKPIDVDAKIWGVEGGFDLQNDINNTFGIFASYRNGEYDLSGNGAKYHSEIGSEIEIDSYLAGLYYRYDKNMNWLFAIVYGGTQEVEAKTDDGVASFETDGLEFGASAEIGHSFALNRSTTLSPSLGVYYTQINYDNANDNVGKKYKWDNIKHLEAELGLSLAKNFENGKAYIKPSVIQTLTDDDSVSITDLNEVDTYHDQTLGRVEVGADYSFSENLSGYGWANYTFGSSYEATSVGVGVSYSWQ